MMSQKVDFYELISFGSKWNWNLSFYRLDSETSFSMKSTQLQLKMRLLSNKLFRKKTLLIAGSKKLLSYLF